MTATERVWKGAKAELEELRRIDAEGNLDLMGRPVARPPLAGLREQELVASARARATKAAGEAYERAKPTEGEPTGFWAGNVFREITDEDALVAARMASNDVFRQFQRTTGIDVQDLIHTMPKDRPVTTGSEMSAPPSKGTLFKRRVAKCIGCGAPASMSASFGPTCPGCYDDYSG